MQGEFDDILGQDDPEKEHKEWIEENKTKEPAKKSFRTLSDVYQKAQKRWAVEKEIKEAVQKEMAESFERAKEKLENQKEEFEQEYMPDFDEPNGHAGLYGEYK